MPERQVCVRGHLGEGGGVRWDRDLVTPLPRALTGSDPGRVASYSGLSVKLKKHNEHFVVGSGFHTKYGLSSFWNPGWV